MTPSPSLSLNRAQEAVERLFADYDNLIDAGVSSAAAIDTVSSFYEVEPFKVGALLDDRRTGRMGNSGETVYGSTSTPSTASSPPRTSSQ